MQPKLDNIKISALEIREVGFVKDIRHGIARVTGLPSCVYGQLIQFSEGTKGIVMGFNPHEVLVIILGEDGRISIGDTVTSVTELIRVPVGENLLGRVVNGMGEPLDGNGPN